MALEVTWLVADGTKVKCELSCDDQGVHMVTGKQAGGYPWEQIHRLSFDDPGRTKASVGYIAVFGVAGLAKRVSYTIVTLSASDQDVYFEAKLPLSMCRTFAHRVLLEVPTARGRVYVDGAQLAVESDIGPTKPSTPAGWYPDPNDGAQQRYFDGSQWTYHYAPRT
jgi:hypothetical protein